MGLTSRGRVALRCRRAGRHPQPPAPLRPRHPARGPRRGVGRPATPPPGRSPGPPPARPRPRERRRVARRPARRALLPPQRCACPAAGRGGPAPRTPSGRHRVLTSAVDQAVLLHEAHDADPGARPCPSTGSAACFPRPCACALSDGPPPAAVALQQANGEVGTTQPLDDLFAVCRAARVPLLVDGTSSLGRVATPETFDVLVGDAAAWRALRSGCSSSEPAPASTCPGPRWEPEHGREPADPWVPLALAAAEAWQQATHARPPSRPRPMPSSTGSVRPRPASPTSTSWATRATDSPTS